MKNQTIIMLRIIIIFAVAFVASFVPETFPKQFNDIHCQGCVYNPSQMVKDSIGHRTWTTANGIGCKQTTLDQHQYTHPATTHWGYRHCLFFWCGLCLALVQVISLGAFIVKLYNTKA
jgi:hypothetical protein